MTGPGRQAVDPRGRRYVLHEERVDVVSRGATRVLPLDDVARPVFLGLPRIDLEDGSPLRREAFLRWSEHLRRALSSGEQLETTHRPARPVDAVLALGGGAAVVLGTVVLLALWARSGPTRVEPGLVGGLARLAVLAAVVWVALRTLAGMARAWLCRGGSFVHLDARGIRTRKGETVRPFGVLRAARYDAFLRCTRLDFRDGAAPLWVPTEPGPMARLDVVLAALEPRLAEVHPELR